MAISFVGSLAPVGANNGGDVTLSFTGLGLQQNDVVIYGYACSIASDFAMAMVSAGWNAIQQHYSNGSTYDTNVAGFWKAMGATPDTSGICDGPAGSANGTIAVAAAFRGVDTVNPIDITPVLAAGTGTTQPNAGAVTPATTGAWPVVIGAGAASAGAAFTNPGDLSTTVNHFRSANHAETNDIAIGIGFKTDWTSGAFDPAAWGGGNSNAANSWAAITFALKPSTTTTHEGAAALSGTGAFAATATRTTQGAALVSGSGSLAAGALKTLQAALAATGAGTSGFVGKLTAAGRAAATGLGSLVANATMAGGKRHRCEPLQPGIKQLGRL